jgi:hypothetical protein
MVEYPKYMRISPEASRWDEQAKKNIRPYGRAILGQILLYSVVSNCYPNIGEFVNESGLLWLKIVNQTKRRRTVRVTIVLSASLKWPNDAKEMSFPLTVGASLNSEEGFEPESAFAERNHTEHFVTIPPEGITSIVTTLNEQVGAQSRSEFFVRINRSSQPSSIMKRDILAVIAEGVSALPGAGLLLRPLLKLREDDQHRGEVESLNAKLSEIMVSQKEISAHLFEQPLALTGASKNSVMIAAETASVIATRLRKEQTPLSSWSQLEVSRFPFPFGRELLRTELNALFGSKASVATLRDALREVNYEDDRFSNDSPQEFINQFIESLIGQKPLTLKVVFDSIVRKRPNSEILTSCQQIFG